MTPGKYPEEHTQYSEHGESLKSTGYIFGSEVTVGFSLVKTCYI
jgi:hypothetical protein